MNTGRIREAMRKAGFTEVINISFMRISDLDILAIDDTDRRRKMMAISNPAASGRRFSDEYLSPALMGNLKYNIDRGMKDVRFFEIARVFEDTGELCRWRSLGSEVSFTGKRPLPCGKRKSRVFMS